MNSVDEIDEIQETSYRLVLQNKDFVKILLAQFGSNIGDAFLRVALYLYIYGLTGNLTLTTLILSIQVLPWIIVGPVIGVLADRISRKAILFTSDILRALCILYLPFTSDLRIIASLSFLVGLASASFAAPRSAAIPEITGLKLYVKAISLSQMLFQVMSVIGPLFAGFIYASLKQRTFFLIVSCFLLSGSIILLTKIPSAKKSGNLTFIAVFSDLKTGFVYLATEKTIRQLIILFTFIIFGSAFAGTLIYPYLYEIVHNGLPSFEDQAQREFGLVGAIIAFGSIFGYLIFSKYEKFIGRPNGIFIGSISFGIYYTIFVFYPTLQILLIIGLVFGVANGMTSLAVNAIFAETVPNEIRGRAYSATNAYIQIFTVVSVSSSGLLADTIGIVPTIVSAGLFLLLAILIYTWKTRYYQFLPSPNTLKVQDSQF